MPMTTATLETFLSPDDFEESIPEFETYPEFMDEVTKVEVPRTAPCAGVV